MHLIPFNGTKYFFHHNIPFHLILATIPFCSCSTPFLFNVLFLHFMLFYFVLFHTWHIVLFHFFSFLYLPNNLRSSQLWTQHTYLLSCSKLRFPYHFGSVLYIGSRSRDPSPFLIWYACVLAQKSGKTLAGNNKRNSANERLTSRSLSLSHHGGSVN